MDFLDKSFHLCEGGKMGHCVKNEKHARVVLSKLPKTILFYGSTKCQYSVNLKISETLLMLKNIPTQQLCVQVFIFVFERALNVNNHTDYNCHLRM